MKVVCPIEYGTEVNEHDKHVEYVEATCPRCGDTERAWGSGDKSVKRALISLREKCSCGSRDFYVAEEEDDEPRYLNPPPSMAQAPVVEAAPVPFSGRGCEYHPAQPAIAAVCRDDGWYLLCKSCLAERPL